MQWLAQYNEHIDYLRFIEYQGAMANAIRTSSKDRQFHARDFMLLPPDPPPDRQATGEERYRAWKAYAAAYGEKVVRRG